jgi:hypothetical protein
MPQCMRLLILAAALMLTGCWMGDGLYSSDDARQPIPAGIYRATARDEKTHIEKVTLLPNGMTTIGDEDGKNLYGFAPLDSDDRRFVVWYRKDEDSPNDHTQLYMLLERQSADEFVLYLPECKGELAELARKAGATIEEGTTDVCHFLTRSSVETAMRQVRISGDVMRIVRVRDK